MSTILKSLQKLEKEKEGQNLSVPAPALITGVGTHQAIHRAVRFALLKGRILRWSIVGTGCFVIVMAALYTINRPSPSKHEMAASPEPIVQPVPKIKPQQPSINPAPADAPSTVAPVAGPQTMAVNSPQSNGTDAAPSMLPMPVAQRPEEPSAISPPTAPPPLAKDGFEALGQKPAPSTMGAVPVQERRLPPKPVQPETVTITKPKSESVHDAISEESLSGAIAAVEPQGPSTAPNKTSSSRAGTPKENKPDPASSTLPSRHRMPPSQTASSKPEQAAYAGAERLTNGSLKVQAIVFAPAAEERMAVVNDTIVREGSAIESYTIVGIGEEDVYVREGQGQLLKVPFGKP